jgi:hypothetical protein
MPVPNPELQPIPLAPRRDRALRRPAGDQRGDDVSPVSSDATGVRENGGGRGREDATRPRRRYITY